MRSGRQKIGFEPTGAVHEHSKVLPNVHKYSANRAITTQLLINYLVDSRTLS